MVARAFQGEVDVLARPFLEVRQRQRQRTPDQAGNATRQVAGLSRGSGCRNE